MTFPSTYMNSSNKAWGQTPEVGKNKIGRARLARMGGSMMFEGLDAALLIENVSFSPLAATGQAAPPEPGPTLDDALLRSGRADGPPGTASPLGRGQMREAVLLDLWIDGTDARGFAPGPSRIGGSGHFAEALRLPEAPDESLALSALPDAAKPMAFGEWEEPLNFDPDQYAQEVANWYGFNSFGYDQLSDRLEEWGRMISDWIAWLTGQAGGEEVAIVVTAPSGLNIGNGMTVVFHHDGSGLISLFQNGVFIHGLEATTASHATIIITITGFGQNASVSYPGGVAEGTQNGGPSATLYFRPGG